MLLTRFVRCCSCGREVRVFDARLSGMLEGGRRLPEDGASSASDGSFECPFCGVVQLPPSD